MAYEQQLDWLVTLAMTPGWWQYARLRSRELEADDSGAFVGLGADVRKRLEAQRFRPARAELAELATAACPPPASGPPQPSPVRVIRAPMSR